MTRDEEWVLREKYGGQKTPEFEADLRRLAEGEPVAYVIGWEPFLGLKIGLQSHPLIPRPETEWWANEMLSAISGQAGKLPEECAQQGGASLSKFSAENYAAPKEDSLSGRQVTFLDLCAGSGAIGCAALVRLPHAQVYFGEVDPAHESTIAENIAENKLDTSRATIRIGNLFEPFQNQTFDFIAANPPYIPEKRKLDESVTGYEPGLALFAGDDGLSLIRKIAEELPRRLKKGGAAYLECDSAHAEAARDLFVTKNLHAEIRTDQYNVPRFIVVSFP